MFSFKNNSS